MTIKFKRGPNGTLPQLAEGEPAFATDTGDFYIGSQSGNKQMATAEQLENIVYNVKLHSANNDGLTNNSLIFNNIITQIGSNLATLTFPQGVYRFSNNVDFPSNIKLVFIKGAQLSVDYGITLTIEGEINAGNDVIFTGNGNIDKSLSPTPYNISWYDGISLNKKWDKMSSNFNDFIQKNIIIPKPYPNQQGAIINPSGGANRWSWLLDGTWFINDYCSLTKLFVFGELYCPTNIGTGVVFGLTSLKPETILLPLGIHLFANSVNRLTVGYEIRSIARLTVNGVMHVDNADTPLIIGGANHTGNINQVIFESFHCGFAKNPITIYGKGGGLSLDTVRFMQLMVDNSVTISDSVCVKGKVNNIYFDDIMYNLGTSGVNAQDVLKIQATSEGSPFQVKAQSVYGNNAQGYGVNTEDLSSGSASQIENLSVENIHINGSSLGINLNYTKSAHVQNVSGGLSILIASNSSYSRIDVTQRNHTIIDNSYGALINGLGKKPYGTGATPNTNEWAIGNKVVNTSDNTVWVKYQDTGTSNSDFIKIA